MGAQTLLKEEAQAFSSPAHILFYLCNNFYFIFVRSDLGRIIGILKVLLET